jgi:hypothetical protein
MSLKGKSMSIRTRNVDKILEQENELFSRIGMVKVGYEGFVPTLLTGGEVWYIACFPHLPNQVYTIRFESWFGNIALTYQKWVNPNSVKINE